MAGDTQRYEAHRFRIRSTVLALLTFIGLILFPVAVTAQQTVQAVSEITVVVGQYTPCPDGFTKIDVDLNKGAGGNFIWLCYKKGVGAPVTGLFVTAGNTGPAPEGYVSTNVDLNRDAGGDTIILWYTKDPNCSVISDIAVVVGQYTPCPDEFTKINVDLNRNAGGNFIWLCYQSQ
jgi:hypothetical protein